MRVHASVIIVGVGVFSVDVLDTTIPGSVATERALVVDTPCQDLVVVGQSNVVHATSNDLNNADLVSVEVRIETRTLDIDALLVSAETKLASGTLAEDEDLQTVGGRLVDDRSLDEGLDLLHRRGFGCLVVGLALCASLCRSCSISLLCSGFGCGFGGSLLSTYSNV